MEKPVPQNLQQVRLGRAPRDEPGVDARRLERRAVRDLDAGQILQGEHARRAELSVDGRRAHPADAAEVAAEAVAACALLLSGMVWLS